VVVDDHDMQITLILRGEDIISATPRQLHIYQALAWEAPEFAHLPLILGPDRSKLSKRHGATAITDYRDRGYLPEALVNFIALLGWSPGGDRELMSRQEMIDSFTIDGIGKSGAVFDIEKLNWMNGHYIRELSPDRFVALAKPFLERAGLVGPDTPEDYLSQALLLEQERAKTLAELPALTEFFFREPESYDAKGAAKWFAREGAAELLAAVRGTLAEATPFDAAAIETALRGLAEARGEKVGPIIHTTRLAATGRTAGPGLFETLAVLGKERVLARLETAERYVEGESVERGA
jgi:glutamyl-tRNA synthetase